MKTFERRMIVTDLEVRDDDGEDLTLTGYASTFSQPYDMGWYTEQVDPQAFTRTLSQSPDVMLLINHTGMPLARTASGTLKLSANKIGLLAEAKLSRSDPDVKSLAPKMLRKDVDSMSFAFRVVPDAKGEPGDIWSADMSSRTLRTLDLNGGDVSVVTRPANPNTSVGLRAGGTAFEAFASAMRAMEARSATHEDVRALLARMQDAFGGTPDGLDVSAAVALGAAVAEAVAIVEETSELVEDDSARKAAIELLEFRKRQLALL